ncbi:hypothetical protein HYY69_01600 [Candidatus Woesearchaeota archaeon]|nr:hypothetical protein [Candidatus Woesearchaeota archaeon]
MDKQLMTKIGYIFIAITLILFGINRYMDYKWEKENAEKELNNQNLLDIALKETDIKYCNDYKYKLGCVVLVGQKLNDENVCEQAYDEEPTITSCKAAILKDKSLCTNNFEKSELRLCETLYDHVLSKIG